MPNCLAPIRDLCDKTLQPLPCASSETAPALGANKLSPSPVAARQLDCRLQALRRSDSTSYAISNTEDVRKDEGGVTMPQGDTKSKTASDFGGRAAPKRSILTHNMQNDWKKTLHQCRRIQWLFCRAKGQRDDVREWLWQFRRQFTAATYEK